MNGHDKCPVPGCSHTFSGVGSGAGSESSDACKAVRKHLNTHRASGNVFAIPGELVAYWNSVECTACTRVFAATNAGRPRHHRCPGHDGVGPAASHPPPPPSGAVPSGAADPIPNVALAPPAPALAPPQPPAAAVLAAPGPAGDGDGLGGDGGGAAQAPVPPAVPLSSQIAAGALAAAGVLPAMLVAVLLFYDQAWAGRSEAHVFSPNELPPFPYAFDSIDDANDFASALLHEARAKEGVSVSERDKFVWLFTSYPPKSLLVKKKPRRDAAAIDPGDAPAGGAAGGDAPAHDPKWRSIWRAYRYITNGSFAAACRSMRPLRFVNLACQAVSEKLRGMLRYVGAALHIPLLQPQSVPEFKAKDVKQAVFLHSATTAPGFTGWSYQQIQFLLRPKPTKGFKDVHAPPHRAKFAENLTWLVNRIATGTFNKGRLRNMWSAVRGIVFGKDDQGGIRPIGIACVFASLTGYLLAHHKDVRAKMRELVDYSDLSHGLSGGAEAVPHILRAAVASNPTHIVAQMDFKNAFNSIARAFVLQLILQIVALGPYIALMYGGTTNVFYTAGVVFLWLRTDVGVTQGCPLGGFLFSAVLTKALRGLVLGKGILFFRYADDMYIVGPSAAVLSLIREVEVKAAVVGLELQKSKSTIWVPSTVPGGDSIRTQAANAGFKVADGVKACGAAVGTTAFMTAFLAEELSTNLKPLELITEYAQSGLSGSVQDAFTLTRFCVCPALFTFLVRTHPPSLIKPMLREVDVAVERAVCRMLGASSEPENASQAAVAAHAHSMERVHLPISHGGLGYPSLVAMAEAAFVASTAKAIPIWVQLLRTSCPNYFPKDNPPSPQGAFADAATLLQEGHAEAAGIKSIQSLFEPRGPSTVKLQQKLLHARKQPLYERLRDSAPTVFIRNLMISQRQAGAGAFLTCANAYRDARLRICNAFFAIATRFYISLPVTDFFSGNLRFIPNAGQNLRCLDCDPLNHPKAGGGKVRKPGVLVRGNDGMHAESCAAGEATGQRASRSFAFTDALAFAVYGGSPAFPEHRQLADGSRVQVRFEPNLGAWGAQRLLAVEPKRRISRADFIVLMGGRKILIDTIVCNPACASILSNPRPSDSKPFSSVAEGSANKVREYNRRVKLPADMPLTVYGFDASGAWAPGTDAHIRSHLKLCYPGLEEDLTLKARYAHALRYARQCTSVVARNFTAKAILAFVQRAQDGRLAPVDQVA